MRWFQRLRRRRSEADYVQEIESHLTHEIDEQIERGLPPEEARYAAVRRFGNVTRHIERFREASPWFWLETLWLDVRYGWRSLRRSRALFLTSLFSVALGIGGSTALFSVLYGTVLHPFTFPDSDKLAVLAAATPGPNAKPAAAPIAGRGLREYATATDVFEGVAGIIASMWLLDGADDPSPTALITCNFFHVAGVRPAIGRTPTEEDCTDTRDRVIVLSHDLWVSRYGARRDVVGRTVEAKPYVGQQGQDQDQQLTIIGVMPPRSSFWNEAAWIPVKATAGFADHLFYVFARLTADSDLSAAKARVATISDRIAPRMTAGNSAPNPPPMTLISLREHTIGGYQSTLYALLLGALGVLLIACINVSMLLAARTAAAHTEIAVRVSLGAGSGRIIRQLAAESLLLATCGGIAGVCLAAAALPALADSVLTAGVGSQAEITLNRPALVAAAALVLAASMLFAIGPALYATRVDPARAVGGGSRTATPRRGGRWRAGLVAAQMALAFPVFCATFALVQRFGQLSVAAAEYAPEHLLMSVPRAAGLDSGRYKDGAERARLWRELDAAIERVPGVLSTASTAPLALNRAVGAVVEPVGIGPSAEWRAQLRCASPDFFSTMKVPVVRGRTFTSSGALAAEPVAVVSESFARAYFGSTDPIGTRVRVKKSSPACPAGGEPLEIVGVVRNTQLPDVQTGNADSPPTLYVSTEVVTPRVSQFLVRTSVPASAVRRDVQRAIASVDPELVGRTRSLHEDVDEAFIRWPRLLVRAALTASVAALLLLVVGVFGVLAYSVAQLTREIGIRMALGATPALIGRQVLGRTLRWTAAGITVGAAAAFLLYRAVSSKVWGLSSVDLNVVGGAVVLVVLSAGLAAWLPTRRAMQVDPASMLKSE